MSWYFNPITGECDQSKADIYASRGIEIKPYVDGDKSAQEVLDKIADDGAFMTVIADTKTNEPLFLCSEDTWHKICIGDIKIEIPDNSDKPWNKK